MYLHRPRLLSLEPPGLGPQLAGCIGGLALAFFFGAATMLALSGDLPRPEMRLPWEGHSGARWLTLVLGAAGCLASVIVASGFGIKLFTILTHRMGWPPIRESEGACRLVQDSTGRWALRMELSERRIPDAPWAHNPGSVAPTSCELLFRLDEAAAGAVSHLTNPDETLIVRWLDLPPLVGGPVLLEVRFPLRAVVADEYPAEALRAA